LLLLLTATVMRGELRRAIHALRVTTTRAERGAERQKKYSANYAPESLGRPTGSRP
jgi:hypothetical protein